MGRLIDADAFKASLEELQPKLDLLASMCVREVIELIEEQPTAYDVDKVIAILNERIRILKIQKGQAEKECREGFDLRIAEAMLIKECIEALTTAYDKERVGVDDGE